MAAGKARHYPKALAALGAGSPPPQASALLAAAEPGGLSILEVAGAPLAIRRCLFRQRPQQGLVVTFEVADGASGREIERQRPLLWRRLEQRGLQVAAIEVVIVR